MDWEKINSDNDKSQAKLEKKIAKSYKDTLLSVRSSLGELYTKYEVNGKLTISEMHKYNRMLKLEKDLYEQVNGLYKINKKEMVNLFGSMYEDTFYKTAFLIEKTTDMNIYTIPLVPEEVQASVQNPISGLTLNETLEHNRIVIIKNIKQAITQGLITGSSYKEMSGKITDVLNQDVNKSIRIVRTEAHRNQVEARISTMKKAQEKGIDMKKRWVSVFDARTRTNHRGLDGQVVKMDEKFKINGNSTEAPGMFGVASEDINCRCRVVAFFDDQVLDGRIAKDESGANVKVPYQTYSEWMKTKMGKRVLEEAEKKVNIKKIVDQSRFKTVQPNHPGTGSKIPSQKKD